MEKVVAIITVYYPKTEHLLNIKKIFKQVDKLIICDNSPNICYEIINKFPEAEYLFFGKNLGLSAAFNIVLKNPKYQWDDNTYIIFFDQDTTIPLNHINSLVNDYEYLISKGYKIGCIGPTFYNKTLQKVEIPTIKENISKSIIKVKSVITTSMLCRYSNIKSIDLWNEEIFLDMSDWDLCWRFLDSNMSCFMSSNSVIQHNVGEDKKKILLYKIRVWKPFREYYQIRDCLYLINKKYVPWNFRIRLLIMLTIRPMMHCLFLDRRIERFKYIFRGICDYLNKVHGELNFKEK